MKSKKQTRPATKESVGSACNAESDSRGYRDFSEEKIEQLERITSRLEHIGITEYVQLSQRTGKILWLSFLSGIARGLGFTVGTALVLAVVFKIVQRLISMNIPYLTEMLNQFIEITRGIH